MRIPSIFDTYGWPLQLEPASAYSVASSNATEVLRSTFPQAEGRPYQTVHPVDPGPKIFLSTTDLVGAVDTSLVVRALVVAKTEKPFLLETDFPVRFSLLRHSTHEHFLLTVAHHIACD